MRESGVRSSCEALASSIRCAPTSSSMRVAARLKLAARRATSSRALDLDAGGEVASAERLDAGLEPLEPPGQAARHRVGGDADDEGDDAEEQDQHEERVALDVADPGGEPASVGERHRPLRAGLAVCPAAIAVAGGRLQRFARRGDDDAGGNRTW